MSDLRDWLTGILKADFPMDGETTSNYHGSLFQKWTGMTHGDLTSRWGWDPGYTTCVSFLAVVDTRIKQSGYAGGTPYFGPSVMDGLYGWHSIGEADQWPAGGDFFLCRDYSGGFKHVGLFLDVYEGYCAWIAGGQAGKIRGYDSIARKTEILPLVGFTGWLNIDEFYA